MFNVYEVYTWDDVTYTELSSYENREQAEQECERLKRENTLKAVTYCVMTDWQYFNLMYKI